MCCVVLVLKINLYVSLLIRSIKKEEGNKEFKLLFRYTGIFSVQMFFVFFVSFLRDKQLEAEKGSKIKEF